MAADFERLQLLLLKCTGSARGRRRSNSRSQAPLLPALLQQRLHCCSSEGRAAPAHACPACPAARVRTNPPVSVNPQQSKPSWRSQAQRRTANRHTRLPSCGSLPFCRGPCRCCELHRLGSGVLVPVVRVTGVLPQLRTLKLEGALMSYHSFFRKGSNLCRRGKAQDRPPRPLAELVQRGLGALAVDELVRSLTLSFPFPSCPWTDACSCRPPSAKQRR
jgi:hypothetical protein